MAANNPLDRTRPNFIKLSDIYGVSTGFEAHPDFPNPKASIRQEVLDSLATAATPNEIQPVEVFLHTDGRVVVLDGAHRVINAIEQGGLDEGSPWAQIKVTRFFGTVLEAQVRSSVANLEFTRGNLTESEEVGIVERLFKLGLDKDAIVNQAGRGNKRWITKITNIIEATPDVLEAVKAGEISLETGSKIATKVPVTEQSQVVEEAKALEKDLGGVDARKELELRKPRFKVASVNSMWGKLWEIYENFRNSYPKVDPEEDGMFETFMFYFRLDGKAYETVFEILDPLYAEYLEKANHPPKKKGRPKAG